jgi:hypothetical protein
MMLPTVSFSTRLTEKSVSLVSGETSCGNSWWIGRNLDDFFLAIGRRHAPEQCRRQKPVGYKRYRSFHFSELRLFRFIFCFFFVHQSCHD